MGDAEDEDGETPEEGAARRLIRASAGRMDAVDAAELMRWRSADPRHEQAWHAAATLWHDVGRLRRDHDGLARLPLRRLPRRAALAAGLFGLTGGTALLWDRGGPGLLVADAVTGTGVSASHVLPDHSTLWLDARSAVDLAFDAVARRVVLRTGAVFARVAEDGRSFSIEVGAAQVGFEGTGSLAVARRQGGLQVAVVDGLARVRPRVGAAVAAVGPGRLLEMTAAGRVLGLRPVGLAGIGAWRQGRLVAEDRPLAEVVEALGAHYRGMILLRGAADQQRVSAALDLADVPAALATLAQVLAIELSWPAPRVAMLRG